MEKLQILFPGPVISRLRRIAEDEDRPISELIRTAVVRFLEQLPPDQGRKSKKSFPTFDGGKILIAPDKLKELIYEDD